MMRRRERKRYNASLKMPRWITPSNCGRCVSIFKYLVLGGAYEGERIKCSREGLGEEEETNCEFASACCSGDREYRRPSFYPSSVSTVSSHLHSTFCDTIEVERRRRSPWIMLQDKHTHFFVFVSKYRQLSHNVIFRNCAERTLPDYY